MMEAGSPGDMGLTHRVEAEAGAVVEKDIGPQHFSLACMWEAELVILGPRA